MLVLNPPIDYILSTERCEEPLFLKKPWFMQFSNPFRISRGFYLLFHFNVLFSIYCYFFCA